MREIGIGFGEKGNRCWELNKSFPGKTADVMIYKPGDLPECCTETFVSDHE